MSFPITKRNTHKIKRNAGKYNYYYYVQENYFLFPCIYVFNYVLFNTFHFNLLKKLNY